MVSEDVGHGFAIGSAGSLPFYFAIGAINAPRKTRFMSGLRHIRDRSPIFGGSVALWCGIFALTSGGL
jgi:hypothetical protein